MFPLQQFVKVTVTDVFSDPLSQRAFVLKSCWTRTAATGGEPDPHQPLWMPSVQILSPVPMKTVQAPHYGAARLKGDITHHPLDILGLTWAPGRASGGASLTRSTG